jgi:hypothetical protein
MNTLAQSPVFWLALIGALAAGYALPVIIGLIRNVQCLGLVVIFNLFPVAWPAALVAACMMPRKEPTTIYPPAYCEPPGCPATTRQHWPYEAR